jgi:dihydroxyacetone kinase-like protein
MIEGFVAAFPDRVRRLDGDPIVVRAAPKPEGRVGMVIGNGSGHEPVAMGWVGTGMLDANAVGPIFTAPGPNLIARAIAAADRGAGVLLLISHHEGDRIAGEMAAQIARIEGHRVETLLMYDDIASAPKGREPERRGGPGTAFVYKIVGQALEEGLDLAGAKALGERVRDATRTLSVAVAPGTSPVSGESMFALPEGEVFLGMGVHGEPGFARMPAGSVDAICERVVDALIEDADLAAGETVVPFVNGAGGTSMMELLIVARGVFRRLDEAGIHHVHPLIGSYVTTQETKGASVSLLHLRDEETLRRWTAPCDVPFFRL